MHFKIMEQGACQGFTFRKGWVGLFIGDELVAATGGWVMARHLMVYRPTRLGWAGMWETQEEFPIIQVLDFLLDHKGEK